MPTIPGSKSGTRPYLELDWSVNSQDIANNRSSVNLKLYLKVDYAIGYSARYTGTLYGASFTSSSGYISKPGRYLLTQRDVWIGHNSDGTKTVTLAADYNLNISWGGTYYGKITLSGSANLGTIPRASTLSAFSFSAQLKNGVANSISYTVDRKSANFRHHIQLRDGNTTVWTWDNQNTNGKNTIPLTGGDVNNLLNRMSTVTSKTFTLRVATRSGVSGGWIGSAVSRTAAVKVHDDVKPTVGTVSLEQVGNTVSTHYLQNKSKVKATFTGSAGYGATIKSSHILVRRKTTNNDVQYITGLTGTTAKTFSLTGTYQVEGSITDSRGRKGWTAWAEFTVTPYSSPIITTLTATRSSSAQTTVSISRAATHTHLDGKNVLTYTVQRRIGTGSWANVNTNPTGTSTEATFSGTSTSTGNSVTSTYDFRMVVTDSFGESAESVVSVSTQRVVLDIHQNEGVGIGKIHERGVLDVDGSAFFDGDVQFLGGLISTMPPVAASVPFSDYPLGMSMFSSHTDSANGFPDGFHTAVNFHGSSYRNGQIVFDYGGRNLYFRGYHMHDGWSAFKRVLTYDERGSNSSGEWLRFSDGLTIMFSYSDHAASTTKGGIATIKQPFPLELTSAYPIFSTESGVLYSSTANISYETSVERRGQRYASSYGRNNQWEVVLKNMSSSTTTTDRARMFCMAIGYT